MNKYDSKLELVDGNCLKLINDRLKDNASVLEFGAAYGRLTEYMQKVRNCTVDIVEIDSEAGRSSSRFARHALIGSDDGNIEKFFWCRKLAEERYDFIIFADVLEHLYDPKLVLQKVKGFLKPDGRILISIPNIAHNSIILNLLRDEFAYTKLGLLDDTHIRFFTYKSLQRLFGELDLNVTYKDATFSDVGYNEVSSRYEDFSQYDLDLLYRHNLGRVYQFIYELSLKESLCHDNIAPLLSLNDDADYNGAPERIAYLEHEVDLMREKNKLLQRELDNYYSHYESMINSDSWRLTEPLRRLGNSVRSLFAKNKHLSLVLKGLKSLKNDGWQKTLFRVGLKGKNLEEWNKELDLDDVEPLKDFTKSIAVHLHLYYLDLMDEFYSYLKYIPYRFDLYISIAREEDIAQVKERFSSLENVDGLDVQKTINRGRDIAPLYVQFGKDIAKHDYFLHIHSKKSLYTGSEQTDWRRDSLKYLLGTSERVERILTLLEKDNVGLVFPDLPQFLPVIVLDWLGNVARGRELLARLGYELEMGFFAYPVGSFFWAKTKAIEPIFNLELQYDDFPEEAGQNDCTIAHALERVIAVVAGKQGFKLGIIENDNKTIAFDRSRSPFIDYLNNGKDKVLTRLLQYDIITFDIFDTLITRVIYQPDDLFRLMGHIFESQKGREIDFLTMRKQAEAKASAKKGSFCNIHDIYEESDAFSGWTNEEREEAKNLEIMLEEKLSLPRYDLLALFNELKEAGKRMILISDMYLTRPIVEKILCNAGYGGYEEIMLSSELGMRKDDSSMWTYFLERYGDLSTIHVGDNIRSDIQLVGDLPRDTNYVMNPHYAFGISRLYPYLKDHLKNELSRSFIFGHIINEVLFNSPWALNTEFCFNNMHMDIDHHLMAERLQEYHIAFDEAELEQIIHAFQKYRILEAKQKI